MENLNVNQIIEQVNKLTHTEQSLIIQTIVRNNKRPSISNDLNEKILKE